MTEIKSTRLTQDERETHVYLDAVSDFAEIDTTVPRDYNRIIKKGWKPTVRYIAADGTVVGYTFRIPRDRISFLSEKKPREVTDAMLEQRRKFVEMVRTQNKPKIHE